LVHWRDWGNIGTGYSVEKATRQPGTPRKSHREDQMHSGKVRENLRRRWAILKLKIKEKAKIAQYLLIRKTPRSRFV
jgi:hypothetical protein